MFRQVIRIFYNRILGIYERQEKTTLEVEIFVSIYLEMHFSLNFILKMCMKCHIYKYIWNKNENIINIYDTLQYPESIK